MRWGGGEGMGKDSITVFTAEGLSRGARIDLLCEAPRGSTRASRGGGGRCKKADFGSIKRKKFVTIGAAQPA